MPVTEKTIDAIRDTKTIGRSVVTFTNGMLCIILTVVSGTADTTAPNSAVYLRNLSIAFGAVVSILNLLLYLIIDILISSCTDNTQDENLLEKMFKNESAQSPDTTIIKGTNAMVEILNHMKIAGNNLDNNSINEKEEFKKQLKELEKSLNLFGTMV
jgi:hypothetical protein